GGAPGARRAGNSPVAQDCAGDGRVRVLEGSALALFGASHAASGSSIGLSAHAAVGLPAAPVDGAADAVKEAQAHAVPLGHLAERFLGAEEGEVRGHVSAVLDGVGIAEHDLLKVAARPEQAAIEGTREELIEDGRAGIEVVVGLKERDDVEMRRESGWERGRPARMEFTFRPRGGLFAGPRLYQSCLAAQQQNVPDVGAL